MNKYIIDFCITNACNLKCSSCDQGCNHSNPWYASLKDIKLWLFDIKEKCKNLETLEISGGEACLHPYFMEICKLCYEILPDIHLSLTSNGTLLKKSSKDLKLLIEKYNISIRITLYPDLLTNTLNLIHQKKLLNDLILDSRPLFNKDSFLLKNSQDSKKTFQKCTSRINSLYFFYQGNFYPCNASIIMNQINPKNTEKNRVNLQNMQTEEELLFLEQENKLCSCCKNTELSCFDSFYHNLNNNLINNYFETIKDVFINNYNNYEKMFLPKNSLIQAIKNPIFLKNLKQTSANKKLLQRFYGNKDYIFLINEQSNLNVIHDIIKQNDNLYCILINTSSNFDTIFFDYIKKYFEIQTYIYKKQNIKDALNFIPFISFCNKQTVIDLT